MELGIVGRVAVVAGGGRGIGRAVALALAREGADVAVLARSENETESAAAEIRAMGRRSLALSVDATDTPAMHSALARVASELAPPTILVLAIAAVYAPKKLQFIGDEEANALIATDVTATIELCRWALPAMMDARFGRIVGIGSLAARTGVSGGSLYAASKAALEGLLRGIAVDYSRRGITANVVSVSFADTERLAGRVGDDSEARERLVRATATRRLPTPAEIADVVTFLCSPRASAITGAVVDATAGAHLNNLW
jgi:meso-butanediol dehydrogenase/(S,S)-butanediol dehydrogenase/diacetyl reductase